MASYYIAYPLLYLLSLLPMWALHGLSTILKFILFDIIGYRKHVVETNMRNSFPEKSEKEIKELANKFYKYFCDLMVEVIKSLSISYNELARRVDIPDQYLDLMNSYARKEQSLIVVMGHHGNWEWGGNAYSVKAQHDFYGIFRPLHNKGFNKIFLKVRTRFRTKLISDKDVSDSIASINELGRPFSLVFIADQSPSGKYMYWTKFLNQETPVFWGVERFAKKYDYPIIYVNMIRTGRGYYKIVARTLVEKPSEMAEEGLITELHTRAIEADIIAQPETWLWTHKRWKRNKKEYYENGGH